MVELLGKRGRGLSDTTLKAPADLPGQPGLSLCTAADHDRVGVRSFDCGNGLVERCDVAIDHERNSDRLLDRAHSTPVGVALVELASGPPMHRNQLNTGSLGAPRQLGGVQYA